MKILHLANHRSTNIGNGAIVLGTERVLREDIGKDLSFFPEPWDDYTLFDTPKFDASFVDRINRDYDALLVGAAVAFNARKRFIHSGMRLDLPLELWPKIVKPVCFYGVSHRVWPGQRVYHLERFKAVMEHLLNDPKVLFTVRNDDTRQWLEGALGRRLDDVDAVPDPTLYVPVKDHWHPQLAQGKANIIISLNNEDDVYRYGGAGRELAWNLLGAFVDENTLLSAWRHIPGWPARRVGFLRRFARVVDALARERDIHVILAPHTFDDLPIIHEFLSHCSPRVGFQLAVAAEVLEAGQASYFYDLYAKADLCLSMRVHSLTPAIGLGVPCVALSSQSRVSSFMQDAGLSEFAVDVFSPEFEDKTLALARRCLDDGPAVRETFKAAVGTLRRRSATFHRKLGAFLGY